MKSFKPNDHHSNNPPADGSADFDERHTDVDFKGEERTNTTIPISVVVRPILLSHNFWGRVRMMRIWRIHPSGRRRSSLAYLRPKASNPQPYRVTRRIITILRPTDSTSDTVRLGASEKHRALMIVCAPQFAMRLKTPTTQSRAVRSCLGSCPYD
jgi:hypothetical protein